MNNSFASKHLKQHLKACDKPKELRLMAPTVQLQVAFQSTMPAARFYSSSFGSLVAFEGIRKATACLGTVNRDLKAYNASVDSFQTTPYLNMPNKYGIDQKHVGDEVVLKGLGPFKLAAVMNTKPYDGATGVVLKREGVETDEFVICFRSAVEISTFVKVGADPLVHAPARLSEQAKVNAFVSNLYDGYKPTLQETVVKGFKKGSKVAFLGFSMGSALAQLCMHHLFVTQGLQAETEHLLLASPRVGNQGFYRELATAATPVTVTTFVAAANYAGKIHMDPVPLLNAFTDPPRLFVIGSLQTPQNAWHERFLQPQQYGTKLHFEVYRPIKGLSKHRCSSVAVFGSFIGSLITGSALDLHNIGYFSIANYGL